jgi:hypothetical protein
LAALGDLSSCGLAIGVEGDETVARRKYANRKFMMIDLQSVVGNKISRLKSAWNALRKRRAHSQIAHAS